MRVSHYDGVLGNWKMLTLMFCGMYQYFWDTFGDYFQNVSHRKTSVCYSFTALLLETARAYYKVRNGYIVIVLYLLLKCSYNSKLCTMRKTCVLKNSC